MSDTQFAVVVLGTIIVIVLELALLLRRSRDGASADTVAKLARIESLLLSVQLASAKQDGTLDGLAGRLSGLAQATSQNLESARQIVNEQLARGSADAREARGELSSNFSALSQTMEQRHSAVDSAQTQRFSSLESSLAQRLEGFQQTVSSRLDESSRALLAHLTQAQSDAASARSGLSEGLGTFRTEMSVTLGTMSTALKEQLEANGSQLRTQFSAQQEALSAQHSSLVLGSQQNADQLRTALNERLAAIQADNTAKLEEMRRIVDEKLHATLEQRLGESFKLVSDRLEQVHKGLGEMQTLAGSVGDLKRVMTNVKARGTWGEMQLAAIVENVLTPDQYARNVKTVPGSDELVEIAIRLPGKNEAPVWLPIDSKYPVEHYQRLIDAQDAGDRAAILAAGTALESSIRLEAKKILGKYVSPPSTTDFAVLYLPTESLFAEVLRRPGLMESIQNECRVMIAGPANLAAMLSSLQMGFRTLAIEKRSSEVWSLLGQVKTEFTKFGEIVDATKKSIDAAARKFEQVDVRTRGIQRKLRAVQALPSAEADNVAALLESDTTDDEN